MYYIWGRRVIVISGSLIWSKILMELIFNPCGEFRWRGPTWPNPLSSPPRWCPWDLFRSFKVFSCAKERERERERESGVRKATGSYRSYSIPGKTAALVTEFAVKDLPLGITAALVPHVCNETPARGQNTLFPKPTILLKYRFGPSEHIHVFLTLLNLKVDL